MDKLLKIVNILISSRFSGDLKITFNQGGIRSIKKIKYEEVRI